jgi:anthranilate synthase component 2
MNHRGRIQRRVDAGSRPSVGLPGLLAIDRHLGRAIQHFAGKLPILGVCLGHQSIGAAFGGKIIRAQELMHGKTSVITTTQEGVFANLPEHFTVNRYHSLAIERETCPDCLKVTAWTPDGEIMGVKHKTLAIEGVQFHPESILTEHGHAMLKNFLEQAA